MRRTFLASVAAGMVRTLVVCLGLGAASYTVAQTPGLPQNPEFDVSRTGVRTIKLLLEEFRPGTGATRGDAGQVESVVLQDLAYSGIFHVLKLAAVSSTDSLSYGTDYRALVRGTVLAEGENIVLKGRLESLPDGGLIFDRDYRTRAEWYREAAHRFADDIVLYLSGENGISRTRVVFSLHEGQRRELYVVDYDGYGLRRLTDTGSITLSPSWNPDLTRIAYTVFAEESFDLQVLDLASGKSAPLAGGPGVQSASAWSPVGDHIAYSETVDGTSAIYVCGGNGQGKRRLTRDTGIDTSPAWSPDGRRVAFVSDRSGNPQLYITDSEGGETRRLTFGGSWNDQPAWSPDGEAIAYASRVDGSFRLFRVDPGGLGAPRQITFGPGSDEAPSWAPDSRHLVFAATRGGATGLYIINTDNHVERPLVVGKGDCNGPDWSLVPPR